MSHDANWIRMRVLLIVASSLVLSEQHAQAAPTWVEQGPGPVPGDGGLVSGAVEAIAADPTDVDRVFVAAVNGGIWRTNNATDPNPNWTPLTDHSVSLSMRSLVLSPLDPNYDTLFAVLGGERSHAIPINGTNANPREGILKTTDGGQNWILLPPITLDGQRIVRVLPTPVTTPNGQVLFAVTLHPLYDLPGGGVYRSSDGGQTWQKRSGSSGVPANGLPDHSFVDIVEDPGNPQRLFTATDNPPRLFRSENLGDTWTELTASVGLPNNTYNPVQLEMSPSADAMGRHWLYLLVAGGPGIFVTRNSGQTWQTLDQPPDGYRWNNELVVSPNAPNLVFAAADINPGHWRGDANAPPGAQWYQVDGSNAGGGHAHVDARDWVFSADPNLMFESDDGGVFRLRNPFSSSPTWDSAVGNLRVTEFLTVAYDSVNHTVFGGAWDVAVPHQTVPNDIAWGAYENALRDGIQVGVDNSMTGASVHYSSMFPTCFGSTIRRTYTSPASFTEQPMGVIINGTAGQTYNIVEGNLPATCPACCFGTVRFNQSWTLNTVSPTRLLLGTDYLYESFDRGDHFESLGGIGTNGSGQPIPLQPVGTVTAYAYGHPTAVNAFYVGTAGNIGGHLLWVRQTSGYPTPVDSYAAAGGSPPRDIAFDPNDWRSVYIADDLGRVWHSADAGATVAGWTNLTGPPGSGTSLSAFTTDLRTIVVMLGNALGQPVVLIGGLGGVFVNRDPGAGASATWSRFGDNLPNAIVTDLLYDPADDLLLAGTLGRGAWTLLNPFFPPVSWVMVGNPGNACESQTQGCFGAVGQQYRISKYEVTNAQFAAFLNAIATSDPNGIYNSAMGITRSGSSGGFSYAAILGRARKPLTALSFYDALRFANWLHNGQPVGLQNATTTEDGAYTFTGPTTVGARNIGARVALPTENEWYKAAYYNPASTTYFDWPTSSNTVPTCSTPTATSNRANCGNVVGDFTNVASYTGSPSPYGTFDQGGNAWEWNETLVGSNRGIRGGSRVDPAAPNLAAANRSSAAPTIEGASANLDGFRVVPEPCAALQLAAGIVALLALARSRYNRVTQSVDEGRLSSPTRSVGEGPLRRRSNRVEWSRRGVRTAARGARRSGRSQP